MEGLPWPQGAAANEGAVVRGLQGGGNEATWANTCSAAGGMQSSSAGAPPHQDHALPGTPPSLRTRRSAVHFSEGNSCEVAGSPTVADCARASGARMQAGSAGGGRGSVRQAESLHLPGGAAGPGEQPLLARTYGRSASDNAKQVGVRGVCGVLGDSGNGAGGGSGEGMGKDAGGRRLSTPPDLGAPRRGGCVLGFARTCSDAYSKLWGGGHRQQAHALRRWVWGEGGGRACWAAALPAWWGKLPHGLHGVASLVAM